MKGIQLNLENEMLGPLGRHVRIKVVAGALEINA